MNTVIDLFYYYYFLLWYQFFEGLLLILFLPQLLLISQSDWLIAVADESPHNAARVKVSRNDFLSSQKHFLWRLYCGKKNKLDVI